MTSTPLPKAKRVSFLNTDPLTPSEIASLQADKRESLKRLREIRAAKKAKAEAAEKTMAKAAAE